MITTRAADNRSRAGAPHTDATSRDPAHSTLVATATAVPKRCLPAGRFPPRILTAHVRRRGRPASRSRRMISDMGMTCDGAPRVLRSIAHEYHSELKRTRERRSIPRSRYGRFAGDCGLVPLAPMRAVNRSRCERPSSRAVAIPICGQRALRDRLMLADDSTAFPSSAKASESMLATRYGGASHALSRRSRRRSPATDLELN